MSPSVIPPNKVLNGPHWRVNFRPLRYRANAIPSVGDCLKIVEASRVRLRGWDYPFLSRKPVQVQIDNTFVASWNDAPEHLDYWRLYQSAQFLHLFAVREAIATEWKQELQTRARQAARPESGVDAMRGVLSIENLLYTVTEIFEFATRLAQRELFVDGLAISIRIAGIKNYAIVPGPNRSWHDLRITAADPIEHTWTFDPKQLIASSASLSLDATDFILKRFGWSNGMAVFEGEQTKFLKGML